MSLDIITPGHIMFLEEIVKKYKHPILYIGLLTAEALRGYKKCTMSYKDRKYIVEHLSINGIEPMVVPQITLNPYKNLIKYNCMAIASGDGWEDSEKAAINKWIEHYSKEHDKLSEREKAEEFPWKPHILNIRLKGERKGTKLYASSRVKNKIKSR